MTFDLERMSLQELKNLLANAQRLGRDDMATKVIRELTKRGAARSAEFAGLRWNQESAAEALKPFVEFSRQVPGNRRTSYTEAGGLKIGRSKDDPDWKWVDTYTAIKTSRLNAVFVCYIPRPGDEAYFELHLSGVLEARYSVEELDQALERWKVIARGAV